MGAISNLSGEANDLLSPARAFAACVAAVVVEPEAGVEAGAGAVASVFFDSQPTTERASAKRAAEDRVDNMATEKSTIPLSRQDLSGFCGVLELGSSLVALCE